MSIIDDKELTCAGPEPLSPRCAGPYPQAVCDGCEGWAQCDADAPFPRLEDDPDLLPGDYLPVGKLVAVDLMEVTDLPEDDDIVWVEDDCPWCDDEDDDEDDDWDDEDEDDEEDY